ncbi:MAG: hypothetical protein OXI26_00505 [bacterium]|nr:hypothetical protein [bacterium]
MSRLRHSTVTFAVLSLVATVLTLATTPATAQDDPPPPPQPEFFIFTNVMTNPATDNDNDGVPDTRWQVRITAEPLGGCVPKRAGVSYESTWINAGEQTGASLATGECVYRISAKARVERSPDCTYRGELAWGASPDDDDYRDGSVITSGRPDGERRLAIRRDPGAGCARANRTYFTLGSEGMVEDLPGASADRDLKARARQAATLGEFTVRVEPEPGSPTVGCDIATTFTVRGDASTSPQELGATGDRCPARASIQSVPAHVKLPKGGYVEFDAALPNIIVDLTPLVRVEAARIAIIQDVAGSANRGEASYSIARSCGGVALASVPAQAASTPLYEGRFTVHSPDIPQFGPAGIYPAVATAHNSSVVVGCAVSVTVTSLTSGCTVAGGTTQTLAWSATDPFSHFDFEFDIGCGGAAPPTTPTPPPSTEDPTDTAPGDGAAVGESGTEVVRIVARRLENGKIEFGLQQRRHDGSWGERVFPTARLFPTTASVGSWLNSSAINLGVADSADSFDEQVRVRITARLRSDGRVEFGLQEHDGTSWGEREFPARRFFPTGARVDRWLHSSVLVVDG